MSEKFELIEAKDLPVTEEEDVTVLCVGADGEMKRRAVDAPVNVMIKITKTDGSEPTAELIVGTYETIRRAFEENKIINVSLFYVSLDSDTGRASYYYCVHSGINAEGLEVIYTSDENYIYYIRPDNTIELEVD